MVGAKVVDVVVVVGAKVVDVVLVVEVVVVVVAHAPVLEIAPSPKVILHQFVPSE